MSCDILLGVNDVEGLWVSFSKLQRRPRHAAARLHTPSPFQQERSLRATTAFLGNALHAPPPQLPSHSFAIVQLLLPGPRCWLKAIYTRLPHEYHSFLCRADSPTLCHVTCSSVHGLR